MKRLLKSCSFLNNYIKKSTCKILFYSVLYFYGTCNAQIVNYIANGSFEDHYYCNGSNSYTILDVKSWSSIDSSNIVGVAGVYLGRCNLKVPLNGATYQFPKSGDAYLGSTFYWFGFRRSYPKNRLKQQLQAGKIYCVKFYINITTSSTYGMDSFGIYFGDNSIDTITRCNWPITYLTPQVQNPSNNVITDTLNWVPITGTFVANGTEKYALLGNFKADIDLDTVMINPTNLPYKVTDVCIDDVSCIPIDLPAFAGNDTSCVIGGSVYIGRARDVGIDEACTWFKLPNTTVAIDTAAGIYVSPTTTSTYVVRQEICGNVKWDTVVVYPSAVGLAELKILNEELRIYPVPANQILELKILNEKLFQDFNNLIICNSLGQMVREEEIAFKEKTVKINIGDLKQGLYQLTINGGSLGAVSKRFVVAR
jgi:hypothetical protein